MKRKILTITADVDMDNNIQIADVCDAIIDEMKGLKNNALQEESYKTTGNLVTVDDELVGDWVIEEKRRRK